MQDWTLESTAEVHKNTKTKKAMITYDSGLNIQIGSLPKKKKQNKKKKKKKKNQLSFIKSKK